MQAAVLQTQPITQEPQGHFSPNYSYTPSIRKNQEKIYEIVVEILHQDFYAENAKNKKALNKGEKIPYPFIRASFNYKGEQRQYTICCANMFKGIREDLEKRIAFYNTNEQKGVFDETLWNNVIKKMVYYHSPQAYLAVLIGATERIGLIWSANPIAVRIPRRALCPEISRLILQADSMGAL